MRDGQTIGRMRVYLCEYVCLSARRVRWGDTAWRRITVISQAEEGGDKKLLQTEREREAYEKSCFDGDRRCKFAGYSEQASPACVTVSISFFF